MHDAVRLCGAAHGATRTSDIIGSLCISVPVHGGVCDGMHVASECACVCVCLCIGYV